MPEVAGAFERREIEAAGRRHLLEHHLWAERAVERVGAEAAGAEWARHEFVERREILEGGPSGTARESTEP